MQQEKTFGTITTLHKLEKHEIPKASLVLADAFQNDPLWSKTIGKENEKGYPVMAEMLLKYCIKYGQIYTPSNNYCFWQVQNPAKDKNMKTGKN